MWQAIDQAGGVIVPCQVLTPDRGDGGLTEAFEVTSLCRLLVSSRAFLDQSEILLIRSCG